MGNKKIFWYMAVLIVLLFVLAACGGADVSDEAETTEEDTAAEEEIVDDVEATGSESDGKGILPTPVTGAKVSATRVGSVMQLDVFFLVQSSISETINLDAVPEWLAGQVTPVEAQFAFGFFDDALPDEADFSPDFEIVTTFLTQPANESELTEAAGTMLVQILQLPDWRPEADHLLLVFVADNGGGFSDDELTQISDTAVSRATAIYPFLVGDVSLETQQAWQQVAQMTNGRLAQISDPATNAEAWSTALIQSLDHALDN